MCIGMTIHNRGICPALMQPTAVTSPRIMQSEAQKSSSLNQRAADEYELPVYVAGSVQELADMVGISCGADKEILDEADCWGLSKGKIGAGASDQKNRKRKARERAE